MCIYWLVFNDYQTSILLQFTKQMNWRFNGILTVYKKYWKTSKYEDISHTHTLHPTCTFSLSFIFISTIIFLFLVNKKQQTLHILLMVLLDWVGSMCHGKWAQYVAESFYLAICQRLTYCNVIWQHNYFQSFHSDQQSEFIIFPSLGWTANYLEVTSKNTVFYKVFLCDGWVS